MNRDSGPLSLPLVSLIVVHYNDPKYLWNCIRSIGRLSYPNIELIIVDNGSTKVSISNMQDYLLSIYYIRPERNLGFAEACNRGIQRAKGEYLFLLNNDIELDPKCVTELVKIMNSDGSIGILQPKMLDYEHRNVFHSSAAGGMIDIIGFPFARGRIFETVERDMGQYDQSIEIFWAGGASLFARKEALHEAGLFDPDFFLYMEEIDLAWRIHLLARYKVIFVPSARIYHIGCPNLGRDHFMRMYYQHRNGLVMLLKNYSRVSILCLLPLRLVLEIGIAFGSLILGRWKRFQAMLKAQCYIIIHLRLILKKRRKVQSMRRTNDKSIMSKMYIGSIALRYVLAHQNIAQVISSIPVEKYSQKLRQ